MISGASSAICTFSPTPLPSFCTTGRGYADVYQYDRYDIFAEANEWLLRALLDLPKKPAVLNLQTMALMFDQITTGGDLHIGLMNYYGPSVGSALLELKLGRLTSA